MTEISDIIGEIKVKPNAAQPGGMVGPAVVLLRVHVLR